MYMYIHTQNTHICLDSHMPVFACGFDICSIMKPLSSSDLMDLYCSCSVVSVVCGGDLFGLSGRLQYPHSSSIEYGHNVNCAWRITTNTTKVLQLNFTKFDIEHSPNCQFDFLQVCIANIIWCQCLMLNFLHFQSYEFVIQCVKIETA
jgi:hypothetical protein